MTHAHTPSPPRSRPPPCTPALPPCDRNAGTTPASDEQAAFFTRDAAAYYERLTGHIEEVAYLIELAEQQAKRT